MHVYRPVAITIPSLKENDEVISILRSLFTNNPPSPRRLATPPGSASPVDELLSGKTQIHFKSCVFAPLPTHNKINCNDESVNNRMKFPYKTYSAVEVSLLRF